MYTKEQIQEQLANNPVWIERAVIVLYNKQTEEEKEIGKTIKSNDVGFNGSDDRYLTYCAKWIKKGNHLSGEHITKCGNRLRKYWRQIQDEIKKKEGQTTNE